MARGPDGLEELAGTGFPDTRETRPVLAVITPD